MAILCNSYCCENNKVKNQIKLSHFRTYEQAGPYPYQILMGGGGGGVRRGGILNKSVMTVSQLYCKHKVLCLRMQGFLKVPRNV